MKKQFLVYLTLGAALAMGSCSKNNQKKSDTTSADGMEAVSTPAGTKLKIDGGQNHGTFRFYSASGGQFAEVAGFSLFAGGTGDVADYTGVPHQLWQVTDVGNGYFTFMNNGSGMYATSYLVNGTPKLIQASADTANTGAQVWQALSVGNAQYKVINKLSGMAITKANDNTITLAAYTGASNQLWSYNQLPNSAYRDDAVVQFFRRKHGSISFDQGNSIPLTYGPNAGKTVWVAEDTYSDANGGWDPKTGTYPCGWFFDIHNSLLLQPASQSWNEKNTDNIITHNSTHKYEAIASPADHNATFTWPGVGIEVGNHVYMYAYEGPENAGYNKTVIYDFTENATGGLDWGTGVRHEVAGVSDQNDIGYVCGWVKPGDGYVYAYGAKSIFIFKNIYVARFKETDPFTWTFWDGTTWAAKPTTATAAIIHFTGHDDGATANTAVSYVNGKYVMAQEDFAYGCPGSDVNIYTSTATSVTGPFTAPKKVFTLADRINGVRSNSYSISIHPQFNNGRNELLITYCINYTGCSGVSTCQNNRLDPFYYQVKGVRIPYSQIGM